MKSDPSFCKKAAYVVLSILFLGVIGLTHLNAQDVFSVGDFYYQINDDGVSATLMSHIDGPAATGELSIPSTISYNGNNYAVTRIGKNAFISCGNLTGLLTIPNTVTYLGENAFLGCSGLTELDLGDALDTIGSAAFYGCKGFTGSLTIPNSVRIMETAAFYGCTGFTGALTIGNGLERFIGTSAFWGCSGFTDSLTIPNSVTCINPNAFRNCSGFTGTLTLGSALVSIGGEAFYNCSGFTKVIALATEPPVFSFEDVFAGCSCTTLTVPCHCIPAYQNSEWHGYFSTIIDDCNNVPELDETMATVYPNPTNGTITIEAENMEGISVYNMLGEKLFEVPARGNGIEYDFNPLDVGVYIVRIQTKSGVLTKRIVVEGK